MDSILTTIKKLLGIPEEVTQFDVDVIIQINSAFSILRQLGVGPEKGFHIEDKYDCWEDFIGDDETVEMFKTYVFQRVRLTFDPPATSFAIDAIKESIKEIEWRLCAEMDGRTWEECRAMNKDREEDGIQNGKCFRTPRRFRHEMGHQKIPTIPERPQGWEGNWCGDKGETEKHHKESHCKNHHKR